MHKEKNDKIPVCKQWVATPLTTTFRALKYVEENLTPKGKGGALSLFPL